MFRVHATDGLAEGLTKTRVSHLITLPKAHRLLHSMIRTLREQGYTVEELEAQGSYLISKRSTDEYLWLSVEEAK